MQEDETFKDIHFEITNTKKLKQRHTDLIEPWMD